MYCINCGVKLADTEKKCPLCETVVYHPDIVRGEGEPLYPKDRIPQRRPKSKAFHGAVIFLFCIPLIIGFMIDFRTNGALTWFGFLAGALLLSYVILALPWWFEKPNPVIFVPCDLAAATVYLLFINLHTGGDWFMPLAFPVMGALTLIVTAVITLLRYLKKGRLYIFGGALMALGGLCVLIEFLLKVTFGFEMVGWSFYPMVALVLLGGLLIYLAINSAAREMMERKLFF